MSPERYYNLRETANLLGIKIRTAREWARTGKLNAVRYADSNRLYVSESEIIKMQSEDENGNKN